jgi:hypothetical protein
MLFAMIFIAIASYINFKNNKYFKIDCNFEIKIICSHSGFAWHQISILYYCFHLTE